MTVKKSGKRRKFEKSASSKARKSRVTGVKGKKSVKRIRVRPGASKKGTRVQAKEGRKKATRLKDSPSGGRAGGARRTFGGLREHDGCGVLLMIAEHAGAEWDEVSRAWELRSATRTGTGGGGVGRLTRIWPCLCRVLSALGHVERAKILGKLLEGPATYKTLQHVTKLKAGPLYHHINQLRLARLILPKQRDLYELTRGGRNVILAAVAMAPLVGDVRRRPVPQV